MAANPNRLRGSNRKPKRPNTRPYDRGRVAALEDAVEELQTQEPV